MGHFALKFSEYHERSFVKTGTANSLMVQDLEPPAEVSKFSAEGSSNAVVLHFHR